MRKILEVRVKPCPEHPLGLHEVFPTVTALIEWLKTSQDYQNEQWIKGTGKRP